MRFFLGILMPLLVFGVHAEESATQIEYPSIEAFQKDLSSQNKNVSFYRTGDISNDGFGDWVGLLNISRDDESPSMQLVVLTGLPNGHYVRRVLTTEVEDNYQGSSSSWFDVEIRKGSLFIEIHGHSCCEFSSTTYQFKLHKGQWRLIGMKAESGSYASDGDSHNDTSEITDTNMLTGTIISVVRRDGTRTERRYQRKVGVFLLNDFDFSGTYAQKR